MNPFLEDENNNIDLFKYLTENKMILRYDIRTKQESLEKVDELLIDLVSTCTHKDLMGVSTKEHTGIDYGSGKNEYTCTLCKSKLTYFE